MKIFVSWSGQASHTAAAALKQWLPKVIQAVDVFLSSEDIAKGTKWAAKLDEVLEESRFGILCLTPESVDRPWVLYEAGAISRSFEESRVVPLLIGMTQADLDDPLSQFNGALAEKGEILKLVRSINESLADDTRLDEDLLLEAFELRWPELEKKLALAAAQTRAVEAFDYDVFLSTPMAGFTSDADYKSWRAEIKLVFDELVQGCGFKVFWASEKIESIADFDTVDVSAQQDIKALDASRCFMLIYPQKLVTSALFEAGYALAKRLPAHYFVRDRQHLPFLMRELPGPFDAIRIHEAEAWKDCADLARKVVRYKNEWFG